MLNQIKQNQTVIIFGAGSTGKNLLPSIEKKGCNILFCDNCITPKSTKDYCGYPLISPKELLVIDYDWIVIASVAGIFEIEQQLLDMGIALEKIICPVAYQIQSLARIHFVEKLHELMVSQNISGNVAEAGVFRGEFAKEINRIFPDRKLYLFDTFEGFDSKDLSFELNPVGGRSFSVSQFSDTSVSLVLNKMPYPSQCIVKKGVFPDSAINLDDSFCFVNLDMDLFQPTLEGLRFFFPRMNPHGVILVHDYFSNTYINVKNAVDTFTNSNSCCAIPIGDMQSIAIIKN